MNCVLTFDDGPKVPATGQILDILGHYGVTGIFFLVGQRAQAQPELVRRIVAEGHKIGNHSYSHQRLPGLSDEAVKDEIRQTQAAIEKITGQRPRLFRPPYGEYDMRVQQICAAEDLEVMIWDVDGRDWEEPGSEVILQRILVGVTRDSIILLHDLPQTVEALPLIIEGLQRKFFL